MPWWGWILVILVILLIWLVSGALRRNRDRRVRVALRIPEAGHPTISMVPSSASAADLALMALCYASKVRWLLSSEPPVVQRMHRELCGELVDFWHEPGGDLIDRSPTASAIRSSVHAPKAVAGGEEFTVDLFRTEYRSLADHASVQNTLPNPGLAANIPWSSILVFNTAFALSGESDRDRMHQATSEWFNAAYKPERTFEGLTGLKELFSCSYGAVANAFGQ